MKILDWISNNWSLIAWLITLIIAIVSGAKESLNLKISKVILFAEKGIDKLPGSSGLSGPEKKSLVVNFIYTKLSKVISFMVTKEYIAKKVDNFIADMYDLKDDGILNSSSIKE